MGSFVDLYEAGSGGFGGLDCPALEEFTLIGNIPVAQQSYCRLQVLAVIEVAFDAIEPRNTGEADDFCKTGL